MEYDNIQWLEYMSCVGWQAVHMCVVSSAQVDWIFWKVGPMNINYEKFWPFDVLCLWDEEFVEETIK